MHVARKYRVMEQIRFRAGARASVQLLWADDEELMKHVATVCIDQLFSSISLQQRIHRSLKPG